MPTIKKILKTFETPQAQFIPAVTKDRCFRFSRAEDCGSPTGPAHSEDRRCHSCDTTRNTSTEHGGGSSESRSSGRRARGDEATGFIDLEGDKNGGDPLDAVHWQSISSGTSVTSARRASETSTSAAHHQGDHCAMAGRQDTRVDHTGWPT